MSFMTILAVGLWASLRLCAASPFLSRSEIGSPRLEVPEGLDIAPDVFKELSTIFGGWGDEASQRVREIKAQIQPAFAAQPHDDGGALGAGHLQVSAARTIVYAYFAREHGWLVKGLEPPGSLHAGHEFQDVVVLRKSPAFLEAISEIHRSGKGFTLGDVSAVVTAIERLLLDESVALLEGVYELNGEDVMDWLNEASLHEILRSYLLIFRLGSHADLSDSVRHQELKARASAKQHSWQEMVAFEADVLHKSKIPEQEAAAQSMRQYSFEDVARIVRQMAMRYGKFQDSECRHMTQDLASLDPVHSGRVALDAFHRQPRNAVYGYKFSESAEYLRHVGALNESDPKVPEVLIADYVNGPSNCIATSQYMSVCCLNECEELMDQLERKVLAPRASPDVLFSKLREISPHVEPHHENGLRVIAVEGNIQLSSTEFASWMHNTFPEKCPTPVQVKEAATSSGQSSWLRPLQVQRPLVPLSHQPTHEGCTRVPEYFL